MNNNQPYWLNENGSYFSNFNAIYARWQEEIRVKLLYSILKQRCGFNSLSDLYLFDVTK